MAGTQRFSDVSDHTVEQKKIEEEKRALKSEQRKQKQEAKRRAKEIAKRQDALDEEKEGSGVAAFFASLLVVIVWLAVIVAIIKLDVGGFGSSVLTPLLKDVPIVNKVLPNSTIFETTDKESYGGYTSLKDAVERIRALEIELESAQNTNTGYKTEITDLKAEVLRLQEFEEKQVEFQRIKTEFYEEVVYAEKGPGAEAYQKYYEAMDPTTAEYIYRQVVVQLEETKEIQDYAKTYSAMKPKQAAGIFESMTDNLELAARILNVMSAEERGDILGVMDKTIAAKITKILNPES